MTITWLGHSCFVLESDGWRVLLDPYKGVPGLPDVQAQVDELYCSHGHFDHAYTEHITYSGRTGSPFTVKEVPVFHDDQGGAKRGENMIRCLTAKNVTVVHLGDLGHQLSREQVAAVGKCDVLLLPVGGTYTVDPQGAKAVADAIQPRVIIPMHYRKGDMGFDVLCGVEEFTALCPAELVHWKEENSLTVDENTPAQVAVLQV